MCSKVIVVSALLGVLLSLVVSAGYANEGLAEGGAFSTLALPEVVTPTGTLVEIDIRPGSEQNPVNPKSHGVLPVGILSSDTFDATEVDPSTVFLAGAPVALRSQQSKYLTSEEDVNIDGLTDLLVKIETELLELDLPTGPVIMVGSTFEGDPFWGEDFVRVVPPDITNDSWALESVAACMSAEIVLGYPDGLYRPEVMVNRNQMAAFLARVLAGGDAAVPKGQHGATFTDVAEDNWAYDYVEYVSAAGLVEGYADGSYQPEATVTRGQMAVFLARALASPQGEEGLADYAPSSPRDFPDVPADFWAWKYIEYCAEQGVVQGYDDGNYHPGSIVTRDQMAVYLARAFELTK